MLKKICNGISAGILISIGGGVFLALAGEHKIIGAIFFSVALLTICFRGYALYTGRIGLIIADHKKETLSALFLGLLGNAIATIVCGFVLRAAITSMGDTAAAICTAKLDQTFLSTLVRAIFCGILMYVAVGIWRDNKTQLGVVFCIPVFILSGYEHSIADIFYFAASGIVSVRAFAYLWTVILGNTIGAWILPMLEYVWKKDKVNA
jgi:formate/nitrite transporter FocA (FNT family)